MEEGETAEEALVRELREELAIGARVGELLCSTIHTYDFGTIELLAYRIASFTGEIKALDHDEIRWVPAGELGEYDFPEASGAILAVLEKA